MLHFHDFSAEAQISEFEVSGGYGDDRVILDGFFLGNAEGEQTLVLRGSVRLDRTSVVARRGTLDLRQASELWLEADLIVGIAGRVLFGGSLVLRGSGSLVVLGTAVADGTGFDSLNLQISNTVVMGSLKTTGNVHLGVAAVVTLLPGESYSRASQPQGGGFARPCTASLSGGGVSLGGWGLLPQCRTGA